MVFFGMGEDDDEVLYTIETPYQACGLSLVMILSIIWHGYTLWIPYGYPMQRV